MKKVLLGMVLLGVVALFGSSAAQAATITIDDYNDTFIGAAGQTLTLSNPGNTPTAFLNASPTAPAVIQGGFRNYTATQTAGGAGTVGTMETSGGIFKFSTNSGQTATFELRYDGTAANDAALALALDLSAASALTIEAGTDLGASLEIFLTDTGGDTAVATVGIPAGGGGFSLNPFNFALNAGTFAGLGLVDLANIGAITIRLNALSNTPDVDGALENFLAVQQIPEPGTFILFGATVVGLIGAYKLRRRRTPTQA